MERIKVEGYECLIEKGDEDHWVITIPSLPGVIGQVQKKEDAKAEIRRLIGVHFKELASKRLKGRKNDDEGGEKRAPDKRFPVRK